MYDAMQQSFYIYALKECTGIILLYFDLIYFNVTNMKLRK